MNENFEQIKALFSDEAFVKTLLDAENEEAVQKMLADKGVEFSLTDIEVIGEMLEGLQDGKVTKEQLEKLANGGELSEEDLEGAAGGGFLKSIFYTYDEWAHFVNGKYVSQEVAEKAGEYVAGPAWILNKGAVAGAVALGVAAVAGIGYGVYDAVRRRW